MLYWKQFNKIGGDNNDKSRNDKHISRKKWTNKSTNGNDVAISGFGSFKVSKRAAREGRNPQTNEKIKIPARKAVTFKAGSALKDIVNK